MKAKLLLLVSSAIAVACAAESEPEGGKGKPETVEALNDSNAGGSSNSSKVTDFEDGAESSSGGAFTAGAPGTDELSLGGAGIGGAGGQNDMPAGGKPGGASLSCLTEDLGSKTGWVVRAGQLAYQEAGGSCHRGEPTRDLSNHYFLWTAPIAGEWHFLTVSFCTTNPALSLSEPDCAGEEIAQESNTKGYFGNALIMRSMAAGERILISLMQETPELASPIGLEISLGNETDCDDGDDNDLDGAVDCQDFDCDAICYPD